MATIKKILYRFNPAIPKKWLLLLAGGMWSAVGVLLFRYAVTWLAHPLTTLNAVLGGLGILISIAANRFEFTRLAMKNIRRIHAMPEKACLFSFQAWKGYLVIAVMMTGGILLRSSTIPKPYLAVVYAAIGGALLLTSLQYYRHFFGLSAAKAPAAEGYKTSRNL